MVVRKANVCLDLSGWSPKYCTDSLPRHLNGGLANKAMFGADYSWTHPPVELTRFRGQAILDAGGAYAQRHL